MAMKFKFLFFFQKVCFDENLVTTLRVLLVLQRMSDCGEISSQLATPLLKSLLDFYTIALKFGTS
jgi:hypothetical protein